VAESLPHYRFTADDYQAMGRAGIIPEDARVELVDGEIIEMSPIGPRHASVVTLLTEHAGAQVPGDVSVRVQQPVRLGERDEPHPDLALVRRRDYETAHPAPANIVLLIEVADTTRVYDRETKLRRYAAAGVPEAWLADLSSSVLERHTDPREGRYRQILIGHPGDVLPSTVLPELTIPVDIALGRPDPGR
jgi:Uma2 family endonuclease